MIRGIGIDIIEVDRVLDSVSRDSGFKEKVFSAAEIAFCENKADRGQHYAVRFAAKEAFLKATGFGLMLGYELCEIELVQDALGKPSIILHGNFLEHATKNGWDNIYVSMSHLQTTACAVVVIES